MKKAAERMLAAAVCFLILVSAFGNIMTIKAEAATGFYSTAETVCIKKNMEKDASMSRYATVQGSCSDGRYAYFAAQSGSTSLIKYDTKTFKKVGLSGSMYALGHANDMTYNSKENIIAVANNAPDFDTVTIVDPDTLKIVSAVKLELKIYSIAYSEAEDCYFVGISGTYDFARLDCDFKLIKKYKGVNTGYTRQGCECDDNYIYFSQSGGNNIIVIYDHSGKYVCTVSIAHSDEIENIFRVGSDYYMTLHYYGNYLYRVGMSDDTMIRYKVNFDSGAGEGKMKSFYVHYGKEKELTANTFEKNGYFFGGWKARRDFDGKYIGYRKGSDKKEWLEPDDIDRYTIYADKAKIAKTVSFGSVTFFPFFICDNYNIGFVSEGEGSMEPMRVGYDEYLTLPQSGFTMQGHIFDGYTAYREYDEKYYGYRKGGDKPMWLSEDELYKKYRFKPEERVRRLTYDGSVMFTAQFKSAFTFSEDKTELIEYSGVDEKAIIPDNDSRLKTICEGCFLDNDLMREAVIPKSVDKIDRGAFSDCGSLESVVFSERVGDDINPKAVINCGSPLAYLIKNDERIFLGWCSDGAVLSIVKNTADIINRS